MRPDIPPLLPGTVIEPAPNPSWGGGPVTIVRELGRGACGYVYIGRSAGGEVVVKSPRTWRGARDLLSEARWMVGRADHDHVARVVATGAMSQETLKTKVPFLIMDYYSGGNLFQAMSRAPERRLLPRIAARAIAEAALGLYTLDVVHRDLKPENLLLDASGNVYVIDFGLAVPADPSLRAKLGISVNGMAGTPPYLSPEQIGEDERLDQRSDIYALGLILIELTTGRMVKPAQVGRDDADWLLEIFETQADVSLVPDAVLRRICATCTQKSRRKRYQTHLELVADLELVR